MLVIEDLPFPFIYLHNLSIKCSPTHKKAYKLVKRTLKCIINTCAKSARIDIRLIFR